MQAATVRAWSQVHTWSSLICTAFLLLLCLTGLPLIFMHEIEHLTSNAAEPAVLPASTPKADVDRVLDAAKARRPGEVVQFLTWDRDEPELIHVFMAPRIDTPPELLNQVILDNRTAEILGEDNSRDGVMNFIYRLHVDLFAGLAGKLFLGAMGLLFVAALVSGVVLYAPFMRRLGFGTVRTHTAPRTRWLDLHNLIGVVTLGWVFVVGFTGVINTWADLVQSYWQSDQLAQMAAPYKDKPMPTALASVQKAVETTQAAAPEMTPSFVAFPGTPFTSKHHYGVYMRGSTPLTARLLKPALIDGETGALTDMREVPWYVTTLRVSQPLHFGDYGGMPLKIVWALLDILTIVVLASGLYLWAARRKANRRTAVPLTSPQAS